VLPDLDRLLAGPPDPDVGQVALGELRERRAELTGWEEAISLTRRMAQGRLDILRYELAQRSEVEPSDTSVLFDLPEVLADGPAAGGGRAVSLPVPGPEADLLLAGLDAVVDPAVLGRLDVLDAARLEELHERLRAHELALSGARRALHERIDAIQEEIGRRYRDGEASVESILG
jgi:hypothetical protein